MRTGSVLNGEAHVDSDERVRSIASVAKHLHNACSDCITSERFTAIDGIEERTRLGTVLSGLDRSASGASSGAFRFLNVFAVVKALRADVQGFSLSVVRMAKASKETDVLEAILKFDVATKKLAADGGGY